MEEQKIEFVGQILDNVHGFIPYTAAEKAIINTQLFNVDYAKKLRISGKYTFIKYIVY